MPQIGSAHAPAVKIISWNVNSVNMRLQRLLRLIETEKPDIVCLQELKCQDEKFPDSKLKALGYACTVFGQKAYNGVAILSRMAALSVTKGFQDKEAETDSRIIQARFDSVTVISAYFPNGQAIGSEKYTYKLHWISRLQSYIRRLQTETGSFILAGDFNVAPEDRDVHDPELWRDKILCSDEERRALLSLTELGMVDTFRLHCTGGGHFSWWDYRQLAFQKNHGLRIDFIMASKEIASRCHAASILRTERKGTGPSDHAPVLAEFD